MTVNERAFLARGSLDSAVVVVSAAAPFRAGAAGDADAAAPLAYGLRTAPRRPRPVNFTLTGRGR